MITCPKCQSTNLGHADYVLRVFTDVRQEGGKVLVNCDEQKMVWEGVSHTHAPYFYCQDCDHAPIEVPLEAYEEANLTLRPRLEVAP